MLNGLWRTEDVAKALDRGLDRAFQLARSEDFPAPVLIVGRVRLWRPDEVRAYVENRADGRRRKRKPKVKT